MWLGHNLEEVQFYFLNCLDAFFFFFLKESLKDTTDQNSVFDY